MSWISWLRKQVDDPDVPWDEELKDSAKNMLRFSTPIIAGIDELLDLYVESGAHDFFEGQRGEEPSAVNQDGSINPYIAAELESDKALGLGQQQPILSQEQIIALVNSGRLTQQQGTLMMQEDYGSPVPPSGGSQITDAQVYAEGGGQAFQIDTQWLTSVGGQPVFAGTYGSGNVPSGTLGMQSIMPFEMMAPQTDKETGEVSIVPVVDQFGIPQIVAEIDPEMQEQGYIFRRLTKSENKPFTIADALRIYDAQDPEAQRLIAEGLALGDGRVSYMLQGSLRDLIFRDPTLIYERDSVFFALENIADEAAARAEVLREHPSDTGYETLDMIPALRDRDLATKMQPRRLGEPVATRPGSLSVGKLTDYLFNLAAETGAIKQVTKASSDKLAARVYTALTGREPDDAFYVLADQWTREVDMERMGTGYAPTEAEYGSHYEQEIKEEYSGKIDAQTGRYAKSALLEALGVG